MDQQELLGALGVKDLSQPVVMTEQYIRNRKGKKVSPTK
jgi:hypothetical protein